MTEKEYYKEKRVSSSSLKWFETSPLFFRKMLDKEIEQEQKRYFEIGKKIHMKLLEPLEFEKNYIYLEYDTPKSENQKKFCEDYITYSSKNKLEKLLYAYKNNYSSDKLSDDKIGEKAEELRKSLSKYITYLKKRSDYKDILTYSDNKLINDIEDCVNSHIAAHSLLKVSEEDKMNGIEEYNENIIFFDFLGVECKSMLDRVVIDHKNKNIFLIDLKTTSNLGDFYHSFEEFKYYRQMAFYWIALQSWLYNKDPKIKLDDYNKQTYIIALQKGNSSEGSIPPECKVFSISDKWLSMGLNEIEYLLLQIKWHYDTNQWEHLRIYYENNGIEIL